MDKNSIWHRIPNSPAVERFLDWLATPVVRNTVRTIAFLTIGAAIVAIFWSWAVEGDASGQCEAACGAAGVRYCAVVPPVYERMAIRVCKGQDIGAVFEVK